MRKHLHPIESFPLSIEEIVNCSDTIGTAMRSCFENVKICLFLIKEASLLDYYCNSNRICAKVIVKISHQII